MKNLFPDPLEYAQEAEIQKKGPSICKKNLQRDRIFTDRCMCSAGYSWPSCRNIRDGKILIGFELIEE